MVRLASSRAGFICQIQFYLVPAAPERKIQAGLKQGLIVL